MTHAAPTEALTALEQSTARMIHGGAAKLELGDTWAEDTARLVLAQPAVRNGLAAAALVEEMAAEHHPVPRRTGSQDLVCARCGTGWRCDYADQLGVPA